MHALAKENTQSIVNTRAVFHEPMFWLKADAPKNICEQNTTEHRTACMAATHAEAAGTVTTVGHGQCSSTDP